MRQAHLYRYTLPIQTGVVLRTQPLHFREGLILQLQQDAQEGWGEIAPLPFFSQESLEEATLQTEMWLNQWLVGDDLSVEDCFPSVACGISFALGELSGKLGGQGNFQTALLCDGDTEKWRAKLERMPKSTVAKFKIGRGSPAEEGQKVNDLLATFSHIQLRLDANRAWSLQQAVEFAEKIAKPLRSHIQFIEEPCRTPKLSVQFAQETDIAIAWDETLREPDFSLDIKGLRAIVIKPTLIGSFKKCVDLVKRAEQRGLIAVISSSLESSLALTQFARFAEQFTPHQIPGLDTLQLMPTQLLRAWSGSNLPLVGLESRFITRLR